MSEHLMKQTIAELHSLVAITLDLYDRLEDLGDGPTDASDLDHIALGLFDRIEAFEAENRRLLEALKQSLDSLTFAQAELQAQAAIPEADGRILQGRIDLVRGVLAQTSTETEGEGDG